MFRVLIILCLNAMYCILKAEKRACHFLYKELETGKDMNTVICIFILMFSKMFCENLQNFKILHFLILCSIFTFSLSCMGFFYWSQLKSGLGLAFQLQLIYTWGKSSLTTGNEWHKNCFQDELTFNLLQIFTICYMYYITKKWKDDMYVYIHEDKFSHIQHIFVP